MSTERQEFKFPDEKSPELTEEELQIEIVDDVPPEDKGRAPLPKEMVEDLEKDDLEEYSEKVKKRLGQMKKVWHDERREKEQAAREREEAIRFAQAQVEENKALKKRLGVGERLFVQEVSKAADDALKTAREKLQAANEEGNAEAITKAQEALTDAKMKQREVSQLRPSLQEEEEGVEVKPQASPAIKVDSKAEAWRGKNSWFGSDSEMTALALGLHDKLVRSGVDPTSDGYYKEIDKTMRKRFPENFEQETSPEPEPQPREEEPQPAPSTRRTATPVAPATRSTAPRQVRLTPSAVAIAKRLGISNEQYARELIKLEKANG